jgi:hypothetical protein
MDYQIEQYQKLYIHRNRISGTSFSELWRAKNKRNIKRQKEKEEISKKNGDRPITLVRFN